MKNHVIIALLLALMLPACSGGNTAATLNDVESYISERPDSALAVLRSMSGSRLRSRKVRAKHALLHSMALDKNYIDLTNDSIIAPAVSWYRFHGTPDEKLKTAYYLGRIYGNAGDSEEEMKCYVRAERYAPKAKDLTAVGMVYSAKGAIYDAIFDFDDAIINYRSAREKYYKSSNYSKYINSSLSLAKLFMDMDENDSLICQLDKAKEFWEYMSDTQKQDYFSLCLQMTPPDRIESLIDNYINTFNDSSKINWLIIADSYSSINDLDNSMKALSACNKFGPELTETPGFMVVLSDLMYKSGNYKQAFEALDKYVELSDQGDMEIFGGNTKSIEDSELAKFQDTVQKLWITVLILGVIVIFLLLILTYSKLKSIISKYRIEKAKLESEKDVLASEKEKYAALYKKAQSEVTELQKLIDSNQMDSDVKAAVQARLSLLNRFIAEKISSGASKTSFSELEQLIEDKSKLMRTTRLSFNLFHPNFIAYLKKSKLSEKEINYCCLYCIGLKGSEIGAYLEFSSFYNISGQIRKKLGIKEYTTNLDIILNEKMKSLD